MTDKKKDTPIFCSFCGKGQQDVERLVVGTEAFICNECVESCKEIFEEYEVKPKRLSLGSIPSPKKIKESLDEYVIGQKQAKKVLATAAYNHYKRIVISSFSKKAKVELQKSNILMVGPTGCGKTLLVKTLAKALNVPFIIVDATTFTEAGYVGGDVEDIIFSLLEKANFSIEDTECGIIYIDEIDKIARGNKAMNTRDVGGEGVQQSLLKLIEGSEVEVPTRSQKKHNSMEESYKVNTSDILFILGGAFVGLEQVEKERTAQKFVGFEVKEEKSIKLSEMEVDVEDLVKFGIIPEFIGRVPIITRLEALDEEALVRILTEPKDALVEQYKELLSLDGVELVFSLEGLKAIAAKAVKRNNGARGLRAIVERLLLNTMYEVPTEKGVEKVVVDGETVERESQPIYVYKNEITQ